MHVTDGVELLDVREAAAYVGRTPETIRRWVWSGRLASVRRGNRLFLARRDLDALIGRLPAPSQTAPLSLRDWAKTVPRAMERTAGSAAHLVTADRWADDHGR